VAAWLGLATVVGALTALAWVLYLAPPDYQARWGWNAAAQAHFAGSLGLPAARLPLGAFVAWLTASLGLAWCAYGVLVAALLRGAELPRSLGALAVLWVLGLALLAPPALSVDVYGYVAYARMLVVYGWNPYAHAQFELRALGDPTAPFLAWDIPSAYGPLWTLLSAGVVAPLWRAPLFAQVVAFKALAALALVALARSAAAISAARDDRWRRVTLAAVLFNPLFVIEGPMSGHNDLVMMALLTTAAAWLLRGRGRAALLLAGLSVSIKLVTAAAIPWMLVHEWRRMGDRDRRRRVLACAELLVIAAAPLVLGQMPFLLGAAGDASGSFLGGLGQHLARHARTPLGDALLQKLPAVLAFVGGTVWVVRRRDPRAWHASFILVAAALVVFGASIWFPWYLTWALALALTRWDRRALAVTIPLLAFGLVLTGCYALRAPGS
jgi:hypothetical protein